MKTFSELEDYLFSQLPIFQNQGAIAFKPGLDRIKALLSLAANPESKVPCVHIAGTNGKGGMAHRLAAVLQSAGYKVGLFTSPHFISIRERIKINGLPVSEERFLWAHAQLKDYSSIKPSFFELLTAIGFLCFENEQVDIAIVEVGMGGRLDSTNVCKPILSLLTGIALDHQAFLGDTVEAIAIEKAGIAKDQVPLLVGPVVLSVKEVLSQRYSSYNLGFDEKQDPDPQNQRLLIRAVEELRKHFSISDDHYYSGVSKVQELTQFWGRYHRVEFLEQAFLLDVAHNQQALSYLFNRVKAENYKQLHIVLSASQDKDIRELSQIIPKEAIIYPTASSVVRSAKASDVLEYLNPSQCDMSFAQGIRSLQDIKALVNRCDTNDLVLVCGSFFIVADFLKIFFKK